jgi:HsdM-like protein
LWKSCDELRGGMDASQYKDYILTLLFVKYVSDKREANPDSLIDVPRVCVLKVSAARAQEFESAAVRRLWSLIASAAFRVGLRREK